MPEIEKYIPKRINKDVDPRAIQRSGDRVFLPGDVLDVRNGRYLSKGSNGLLKNVKGNVQVPLFLGNPPITGNVVGATVNERDNTLIYFIRKTLADWIVEWNPVDNSLTKILESDLDLPEGGFVVAWCIDGLLIWNDSVNPPRKISIDRGRLGLYNGALFEYEISLAAYGPVVPPTVARISNGSKNYNYVTSSIFQFSYRFIYQDNTYSPIAPASVAVAGLMKADPSNTVDNGIRVSFPAEVRRNAILKAVEFLYRTLGGSWNIFETITTLPSVTVTADFFNDAKSTPLSANEQNNLFDSIPSRTDALAIARSRVFCPVNKVGFDVENSFTFSAAATTDVGNSSDFESDTISRDKKYFKDGARHGIGIVFFDQYDKPSFVRQERYVQFPVLESVSGAGYDGGCQILNKATITWSITGAPPAGMKRYAIVLTREQNYTVYMQCIAFPFRYVRDIGTTEVDNVTVFTGSGSMDPDIYKFRWLGKEFNSVKNGGGGTESIYLQLPSNLPFVPQAGDFVRILNDNYNLSGKFYPIQGIIGQWIDIGKVQALMTNDLTIDANKNLFIEIYRPRTVLDEQFFEIAKFYDITAGGAFTVTSGEIGGPAHTVVLDQNDTSDYKFYYNYIPGLPALNGATMDPVALGTELTGKIRVESPTNIMEGVSVLLEGSNIGGNLFAEEGAGFLQKRVFTLNYAKPDGDYGRPHVTNVFEKKFNLNTVVGYSDPYVQGTSFNGLGTFPAENNYTIPVERTSIRSLVKAGDNLVAVCEQSVSSLYLGRGVLKQGLDFLTAKVEGVIGDDNEMMAKNGTINPESVKVIDARVYFWDAINGAVCRWTNAGVYEISKNLMENYFHEKGRIYYPYRDEVKIVTGYDKTNDEFLITFPAIPTVVEAETWAFHITEEVWCQRYDFIPECYGNISLDFVAFKEGQLWIQNKNEIHNNFFGVQYKRSWRLAMNALPGKIKQLLNVHHDGEITTNLDSEDVVVQIATPEGQLSFIPAYEFDFEGGKYKASVLRNVNTPVDFGKLALRSGAIMESDYFEVEFINDRTDESSCSDVNLVFITKEYSR